VGVESAAALQTQTLSSPGASGIAFTALFGSPMAVLRELGYVRLAFTLNIFSVGDSQILLQNTDGTGRVRISTSDAQGPSWSPDGARLAFSGIRGTTFARDILTCAANGTDERNLTQHPAQDFNPDWSPDGSRLAFVSNRDGDAEIYVVNQDGTGLLRLTQSPSSDQDPAWSPDGRRIAFASDRTPPVAGAFSLFAMNADGSGVVQLTTTTPDREPSWSPDGSRIVFQSRRAGNADLFVVDADGSDQQRLTDRPGDELGPAWSPDGRRIAFESRERSATSDLFSVRSDGTDWRAITTTAAQEEEPDWLPKATPRRTLVGPAGADNGAGPPFGARQHLVVVGLTAEGVVSAAAVVVPDAAAPTLQVEALTNIGTEVAGLKATASQFSAVREDVGRGLPPRVWSVVTAPPSGTVLVFWAGDTGRISAVVAVADSATEAPRVQRQGGRLTVEGLIEGVWLATDPARNVVPSRGLRKLELDVDRGRLAAGR
jgi:Tol biopolymer transport system component